MDTAQPASLDALVEFSTTPTTSIHLGTWPGQWEQKFALIEVPGHCEALAALVLDSVVLSPNCRVLVVFPSNSARAVVVGAMPGDAPIEARPDTVQIDGETLVLEAQREVIIRCGKSSIQLSKDGKVRIRGTDILSRSSGGQRIKGGRVNIN